MIRMICAGLVLAVCACVGNPSDGDGKGAEPALATETAAVCSEGGTEVPTSPTLTFTYQGGTANDGGYFDHCWLSGEIWHCEHWHSCKTASGCCTNKWLSTNCIKGPNTQCINCQDGCDCQR